MTREEHLQWCKQRAFYYLERGETLEALTSMGCDLEKHPETRDHPGTTIGMQLYMIGNLHAVDEMQHFIEGFR